MRGPRLGVGTSVSSLSISGRGRYWTGLRLKRTWRGRLEELRGAGEDGDSPSCLRVEWREEEGRAGDWRTQASDSVSRKVEGGTRLNTVRGAVSEVEGCGI